MENNWRNRGDCQVEFVNSNYRGNRGRQNSSRGRYQGNQQQNWRGRNQSDNYQNDSGRQNAEQNDSEPWWSGMEKTQTQTPQRTRRSRNPDDIDKYIDVPSDKVGKIIGRGGVKIRELQDDTSTEIRIQKDCTFDGMTKVKLIGLESDVQKVQELIEELVIDKPKVSFDSIEPSSTNDFEESYEPVDWQALSRTCEEETKAFWDKLPEIVKNFYIEDPEVANLTPDQVEDIRAANNNISVGYVFEDKTHEKKIPNPVTTFAQCFRYYPEILEGIYKMGFEKPSPIQSQAWPVLLSGQDLIGIAQTGTGKTLAFLLPALIHIEGQTTPRPERSGPTVLVLAPTRELAQQIEKEVKKYNYKDMKAVCLYGGGNRREQVKTCIQGVEIVIATPGRLSDLTVAGHIDLKSVSYLVLDEADRMLDLGFEPQIRKILLDIRPNRQTVMTSATWPPGVRRLAQAYTQDPVQVCVGTLDLAAVHSVTQTVIILEDNDEAKYNELINFINSMDDEMKVIVFCGKKARVDHLASELCLAGIECQTIHGDLEQSDREQALADIGSGKVNILIATDVASRGLDITDITHVINYDFPRNVEEYVHRVGRTGRAGRTGESISFVTRGDWSNAKELILILEEANQSIPEELYNMSARYEAFQERRARERQVLRDSGRGSGGGGGGRNRNRW